MPDSKQNYTGDKKSETESIKKKVERVTTSDAVQRKKPLGKRISETFTGDDVHSVGQYILFEVLIPAAKTTISDAVSQGIERMLFGDSRPNAARRSSSYTPYNRMGASKSEPRSLSRQARATHNFDEIVLRSRGEAEEVIEQLTALVEQYDIATISDLYELVGITGSFTDDKWGWSDLRTARVHRVREGYLVDLPKPTPID